ncbi:MAG: sodium:proton antiporter NhaD [Bacteroidales bacterium]|nr:sodium:proton antiporter NhaD [Bacteroidales bacterium]
MVLYYLMPIVFIIGILAIAFEDMIKVNKAATAVGMSILLWAIFLIDSTGIFSTHQPANLVPFLNAFPKFAELSVSELAYKFIEFRMIDSLGDVATTLFFVLGSMAIIDIVDSHGGFSVISSAIKTNAPRKLLWIISFISFFMAAILGDLATVIVLIAIARKLVPERETRLLFSGMIIITANAGGCWSPIGDVTTLILWTGGNLTVGHQVTTLIIPALAMMLVPLVATTMLLPKDGKLAPAAVSGKNSYDKISPKFRKRILVVGLSSLVLIPILQMLIQLPPFMGVLLGLVALWIMTDRRYTQTDDEELQNLRVHRVLSRVDISTVFFFLGILMSVQALNATGFLTELGQYLSDTFSNANHIAMIFGVLSSFLDNVALVSATMGMYPLAETGDFMTNSPFWTLMAYCAVSGGSLLIIGSAAGVTAMGIEKISFGYYLKRFTPWVLAGFLLGAAVFALIF